MNEELFTSLVQQVVSGLHYLHYPKEPKTELGRIVHADINASSVLVQLPGPRFKIGDIDDSDREHKHKWTSYSDFKSVYGTTLHMSPEMLSLYDLNKTESQNQLSGRKTDVWSLGCMVVDVCTPGGLQYTYFGNGETAVEEIPLITPTNQITFAHSLYVNKKNAFPDRRRTALFAIDFTELCLQRDVTMRSTSQQLFSILKCPNFQSEVKNKARFLKKAQENVQTFNLISKKTRPRPADQGFSQIRSVELPTPFPVTKDTKVAQAAEEQYTWPYWYVEEKSLGNGAYGAVVKALDTRNGREVAIKKQFTNYSVVDKKEKPVLALRAYRELLLLWTFRGHPNADATMQTLCLVNSLMDMDLGNALCEGRITAKMRPLVMHSFICGIKFIHSADVIHRDLKPSNIGISFDSNNDVRDVRLLDFGLARKLNYNMSHVVQTMWYRAPEVWLQAGKYTKAIDMWSVGCILAEMISGQVLMCGGTAFGAQLQTIHTYLGEVDEDYMQRVDHSYKQLLTEFSRLRRLPFSEVLPMASDQELDLLENVLRWNPDERWTATQCFNRPYFSSVVQQRGNGRVFTGKQPDQTFEDWDNRTISFWTEWINQQITTIQNDVTTPLPPSETK